MALTPSLVLDRPGREAEGQPPTDDRRRLVAVGRLSAVCMAAGGSAIGDAP